VIPFETFDSSLLAVANALRSPFLDIFFPAITWLGSLWLLVPFCELLILTWRGGSRTNPWCIAVSLLVASLAAFLLKIMFARPRPELFASIITLPADAAFPSAHAAQVMAVGLALMLVLPARWRWPLAVPIIALVLLVGASRLYLQVHWPSDVVAGYVLGVLSALLVRWLWRSSPAICAG